MPLLSAASGSGLAQEEEVSAGGKPEYQHHCATCHGVGGKGDGPSASLLKVKPADLTQLSKTYNGQFPFWRVYQVIDGRQVVSGHGTSEMPIWGDQFQMGAAGSGAEALVRGRILQLVYYLQSIQEK
jgi:mono/diheme cytochrome c family protein